MIFILCIIAVVCTLKINKIDILKNITNGTLSTDNCKFSSKYTFTVYIVSKDYAVRSNKEATVFKLNTKAIKEQGLKIYFANAKEVGADTYTSVSNSRLFAISTSGKDFEEIRKKVYDAIEENVDKVLDYRKDIGQIYVH